MGNFVFALFRSGNATAVGYNSASGQWGVKSGKWGVKGLNLGLGAVLGIDLGLG